MFHLILLVNRHRLDIHHAVEKRRKLFANRSSGLLPGMSVHC